ncbi:MAG: SRPBCC family protein [Solirubrobacterales bacterium]
MPRVSRARVIAVDPGHVWDLISDPHSLPRWWPRTLRVEDVEDGGERSDAASRWTLVLETERGSAVRADYHRTEHEPGHAYAWSQEVEGTPFERILRASRLEIELQAAGGGAGTEVRLTSDETLRGLSRLGSTMLRGAARRRLDEALDGIERALVGDPAKTDDG